MINSMGIPINFHLDSGVVFQPLLSWTTTMPSTYSTWPVLCHVWLATSFCKFFLQCYSQIQDVHLCIFFFINSWKILYISHGFVIHSFRIKDMYLPHNRSGVTKWFIKP
jgi:hypothetical protein